MSVADYIDTNSDDGRHRTYHVIGQVFFASAEKFVNVFHVNEGLDSVTIDLPRAHFRDIPAVGALDRVMLRLGQDGTGATLIGMNEASATVVDKFGAYYKAESLQLNAGK